MIVRNFGMPVKPALEVAGHRQPRIAMDRFVDMEAGMSAGSTLTHDLADRRRVTAMVAHLLVCNECAKVAMMVARACVAGVFVEHGSNLPPQLLSSGRDARPWLRKAGRVLPLRMAPKRALTAGPSPADARLIHPVAVRRTRPRGTQATFTIVTGKTSPPDAA
jgi:hypothetical protein